MLGRMSLDRRLLLAIVALFASAATLLAGCTTRGVYEGVRRGERMRCQEVADSERAKCLQRQEDDYDTYRRKREEAATSQDATREPRRSMTNDEQW